MNFSFSDRMNAERGVEYHLPDFSDGPPQKVGLSMPTWFQFPRPILALPAVPTIVAVSNLLDNLTPDGKMRLTLRDKTVRLEKGKEVPNHRANYEFTVSASKTITLLAICLCDFRIIRVYENVIWEALILAAKYAATRVRRNGADHDRTTGHVIGLLLHHIISRAGDPQLHSHAIFFNVTWDPVEECFKALQFDPILHQKEFIRYWVSARLHEELRFLGYDLEPARHGFRIAGVPEEAEPIISKRTIALEEAVRALEKRKGKVTLADRKNLVLSIRGTKEEEEWDTMISRWKGELSDHWEAMEKVFANAESRKRKPFPQMERRTAAGRVLKATLDVLLETHACVTPELLLARTLRKADGGWNGNDAKSVVELGLKEGTYLSVNGSSLTSPERQEHLFTSFTQAHVLVGPPGRLRVRATHPNLNQALHLTFAGTKIIVAATNTTKVCKAVVRGFHDGIRALGFTPEYAMPESINPCGRAKRLSQALAEAGEIVVVGQAEKLSHSELDAIIQFAAPPGRQVILCASQKALKEQQSSSIVAAFARHLWVPYADLTSNHTSALKSRPNCVPRSLVMVEGKKDRAVSKVAEIAARSLANYEIVQVIIDDPNLENHLSEKIEDHLSKITDLPPTLLTAYRPLPPSPPRRDDRAISTSTTRHFTQGECISVVGLSGDAITVKKANGQTIPIKPKVWSKLKPVTPTEIHIQPGTVLTLTAGFPGKKHRLREGTSVQVKSISGSGKIHLTSGDELPPWFAFFRHGYIADPSEKTLPGKAIVMLRKPSKRTMRTLIRGLSKSGRLLGLSLRKAARRKSLSENAVELAMAKVHPLFPHPTPESKAGAIEVANLRQPHPVLPQEPNSRAKKSENPTGKRSQSAFPDIPIQPPKPTKPKMKPINPYERESPQQSDNP